MAEIKEIRISGFRGIKTPLVLNFQKNKSSQSMIIYGRNGTGKSSITDAWEWLQTEKIEHLRREGAGQNSYPHKFSNQGETFVEVDFVNQDLGNIKLEFDFAKITKFLQSGDIEKFRAITPHPCFIRFEDLTRFVYQTKTEKFDALAKLMGFMPQVELQKSFKRSLRTFKEKIEDKEQEKNKLESRLKVCLKIESISEDIFLSTMNSILSSNNIECVSKIKQLNEKGKLLNDLVINDPNSKILAEYKYIEKIVSSIPELSTIITDIETYLSMLDTFLSKEIEFSRILLIDLYEKGENLLSQADDMGNMIYRKIADSGNQIDVCPLCGQEFHGDLFAHINEELTSLRELKAERDTLEGHRKNLLKALPKEDSVSLKILGKKLNEYDKLFSLNDMNQSGLEVSGCISKLSNYLEKDIEEFKSYPKDEIATLLKDINRDYANFLSNKGKTEELIRNSIDKIETDNSKRSHLVDNNNDFKNSLELWEEILTVRNTLQNYYHTAVDFEKIVNDFVQSSVANVEVRFKTISDDVKSFFEILEQDTEGLNGAVLKLLADEDRAVELQVDFHGDQIYPAYKYLSESQLNSFGLAVFLASAKYFNSEFKFIILDDIINSFDGYKRPRICQLLKDCFPDHQFLLLTHDNVWRDRLFEKFPSTIKMSFSRWEINHGPVVVECVSTIEEIQELIDQDKPVQAGSLMGPFLERQLQELCENFEVMVKYSRLNEYTLDPLIDRFRMRVQEKLGKDHDLVAAIEKLQGEIGFRNLCAHWKNPDIPLTSPEMKIVVEKWLVIESFVRCQHEECMDWLAYSNKDSSFICGCGKSKLVKNI